METGVQGSNINADTLGTAIAVSKILSYISPRSPVSPKNCGKLTCLLASWVKFQPLCHAPQGVEYYTWHVLLQICVQSLIIKYPEAKRMFTQHFLPKWILSSSSRVSWPSYQMWEKNYLNGVLNFLNPLSWWPTDILLQGGFTCFKWNTNDHLGGRKKPSMGVSPVAQAVAAPWS